jgi:hypothetical protein
LVVFFRDHAIDLSELTIAHPIVRVAKSAEKEAREVAGG